MRRRLGLAAAAAAALVAVALVSVVPVCHGYNITRILAEHPEFSTFNHYLTATRLAADINRRLTITVLAVDNSGMAALLAKHLSLYALRNVLELHILVDYFGAKKLHQLTGGSTTSASMFQSTGSAAGTSGYVNITDHRAGRVTFVAQDAGDAAPVSFVKSVKELPYNISVLQISSVLTSPEAEAPTPGPAPVNLTDLMAAKGCKLFAGLLISSGEAKTFQDNVDSGLTVFCPADAAVSAFMPKYKNLTADGKAALLLYHGYPVYSSLQTLKSNNGVVNTLATDGTSKNFNFTVQNDGEVVTLKTRIVTATITATVLDQDPLAVYTIDKVLQPRELFKTAEPSAPAPAPAADAPKGHKGHKTHPAAASPPEPEGPDAAPADEKAADDNAAAPAFSGRWAALALTVAAAVAMAA